MLLSVLELQISDCIYKRQNNKLAITIFFLCNFNLVEFRF